MMSSTCPDAWRVELHGCGRGKGGMVVGTNGSSAMHLSPACKGVLGDTWSFLHQHCKACNLSTQCMVKTTLRGWMCTATKGILVLGAEEEEEHGQVDGGHGGGVDVHLGAGYAVVHL